MFVILPRILSVRCVSLVNVFEVFITTKARRTLRLDRENRERRIFPTDSDAALA